MARYRGVCAERPRKNDGSRRAGGADVGPRQKRSEIRDDSLTFALLDIRPYCYLTSLVGRTRLLPSFLREGPAGKPRIGELAPSSVARRSPALPLGRRPSGSVRVPAGCCPFGLVGVVPLGRCPDGTLRSQRGNAPAARYGAKGASPRRHAAKPQVDGGTKGATPRRHGAVATRA